MFNEGLMGLPNLRVQYRKGKMNQIARCDWLPEWARWSYLARSGLRPVSHKKITPKAKSVKSQSRWLTIGLVLFLRIYGPQLHLGL